MNAKSALVRNHWIVFGLIAAGCAAAQEELEQRIPVQVENTHAVSAGNGMLRISKTYPAQRPGERQVTFEAEDYCDVFWQGVSQNTTSSEDLLRAMEAVGSLKAYDAPDASGGKYIERVSSATWYFSIAEPGDYTLWYRLYKPREANWIFKRSLSRAGSADVHLSGPVGEWFWQSEKIGRLDKRTFRLQIAEFFNGKRLDKLVLSCDPGFVPEGEGPKATLPADNIREGIVEFAPVSVVVGKTPARIVMKQMNNSGSVLLLCRSEAGTPWVKVGSDGTFPLPAGEHPLMLQAVLTVGPDGAGPEVMLPEIVTTVSPERFAVLKSADARYLFDRARGELSSILLAGGSSIKAPAGGGRIFRLQVKPDNNSTQGAIELESDAFEMTGCEELPDGLRFRFINQENGLSVTAENRLTPAGYLDLALAVRNDGTKDVLEVEYPVMKQVRIGADANDDCLLWPFGTGRKYNTPVSQSALTAYYPRAAVGFFDLYDASAGFYMANHDPELYSTVMNAGADESRTWMNFSFVRRNRIRAGGGEVNYRFALGAHAADWHTAAGWYKAWYRTAFPEFKAPDWTQESDGWLFDNLSQNQVRYGQLPETVFRRAMMFGLSHVQLWGTDGSSSCPTYYYPPAFVGGPEEMKAASIWWRARGGQVGYYLLPQGPSAWFFGDHSKAYFGVPWEEIPEWAAPPGKTTGTAWEWLKRNARYARPDRRLEVNYGGARTPHNNPVETDRTYPWDYMPMSGYSKDWNDWFTFWVAGKYVRDWKCATVYLDTFHTQADEPDYNPHLGLHGDGQGGKYRAGLAKQISDTGKRYDPDFLPIMEMQCDAYTPWMAIQCSSSAKDTEMYKFTHPECLFFEGHTAQGTRGNEVKFKRFGSCWLYGNRFDHRIADAWTAEALRLRRWVTRWINSARFLDDLGLTISSPDVKGKLHRVMTADGTRGFLVTFWNPGRQEWPAENDTLTGREWKPCSVRIDLAPLAQTDATGTAPADWIPRRAVLVSLGEEPRPLNYQVNGTAVEFELPSRQLNGVLFVCAAKGPYQFLAQCRQTRFKQLDVELLNLTGVELSGTVTPDSPEFALGQRQSFALPAEGRAAVSFAYPDARPPQVATSLAMKIDTADGGRILRTVAYPFTDDPSFEVDSWRTYDDTAAVDGRRSLRLEPGTQGKFRLYLEPNRNYRLSFSAKSREGGSGAATLLFDWRGPADKVSGKTLFFRDTLRTGSEWKEFEYTFRTPPMIFECPLTVSVPPNGTDALLDDFRLAELPDAATVRFLPDHKW